MNETFSTLVDRFETNKEAKKARDSRYRKLKKDGVECVRWVMDDHSGNVFYMIDIRE